MQTITVWHLGNPMVFLFLHKYLQLIDDSNTVIGKLNDSIRVPQSSLATIFFINWSKEDMKKINTDHLEYLPEVFMYAPPAKRRIICYYVLA
jgi:ubiquitin carboxyl-terminal hydrolase 4/11/15